VSCTIFHITLYWFNKLCSIESRIECLYKVDVYNPVACCSYHFLVSVPNYIFFMAFQMEARIEKPKNTSTVSKLLYVLPPESQTTLLNSRKKHGVRFSNKYLYECILLKIKNTGTYKHIRKRRLMYLPSLSTIYDRIRSLRASFGFQPNLFEVLKQKAEGMKNFEKRGNIPFSIHFQSFELLQYRISCGY